MMENEERIRDRGRDAGADDMQIYLTELWIE